MHRTIRLLTLCALATVLGGCGGDPAKVSKDDLQRVERSQENLKIGMSKDEALGLFKKGSTTRLAATSLGEDSVEEWKVEAYHDDDWNKERSMFVTFMYFMNDRLVDISDARLVYRDNADLVQRWRSGSGN